MKTLPGHLPPRAKLMVAKSDLPATNELRLALGVPLHDAAGLEMFLQSVADPHSPNFRHFLTPEQFTARFGPTESDYAAVKKFAQTNGFKITAEHAGRLVLDVSGPVSAVQHAFQLKLKRFKHPTEARDFFAPDREPTVDAALPLADVSGLSNFQRPHPNLVVHPKTISARAKPRSGSAPDGSGDFFGNDFRNAYVPDTTLTGAGQVIGLLQFDGYYASDIAAFQAAAGLPNIPVQSVLLDGYDGTPGSGSGEVALDIEMAMSMAPGISKVITYSAGPNGFQNDILSSMAANNTVKQFSCSWGWSGGPNTTTDNLFRQLAAQGQSFFCATGDSDAYTTGRNSLNAVDNPNLQNAPSSSPYITQVGGTYLNTSGGDWSSETVWNWGGSSGTGSSGGVSSYYAIPGWQVGVSMTKNHGSTLTRNIPDVAMVADFVYYFHDHGQQSMVAGTSIAAPLWAGFAALANQQAATLGKPPLGLINAAIYSLGKSSGYTNTFHDIISGDNTSPDSPLQYYAVAGYDLCTGWGTPAGQKLIDALVGAPNTLQISSAANFTASGVKGGPFSPAPASITLFNSGATAVTWALQNPTVASWFKISPFNGLLPSGGSTNLTLTYNAATTNLAAGTYTASYKFTNYTARSLQTVPFTLQVLPILSATPTNGFTANGAVGGPFDITSQTFTVLNRGVVSNVWRVVKVANWLSILPTNTGGIFGNYDTASFTVALNTNANRLAVGTFTTPVYLYNKLNQLVQIIPFAVRVGQTIVSNGGFETGNFNGWSVAASTTFVSNRLIFVHSGRYSAMLGQGNTLGYLSQTLPTLAGQTYQLSLWLENPKNNLGAMPNEFSVTWEGNPIYDGVNIPFTNWTNLKFTVTATGNGSLLQLGFRDDPYYLGLDDITLIPIQAPVVTSIAQKSISVSGGNNLTAFNFSFAVTAGYFYQIQTQTNLLSEDWQNLGSTILATNASLNFSDTNTASVPQKFYRLRLIPIAN